MQSWIFAAARAAGILTFGMLACTGVVGIVGFYLAVAEVISIDQIAHAIDTARDWHLRVAGGYGATVLAIATSYYRSWRSAENAVAFQRAVTDAVSALVGPVSTPQGGTRGNR